MSDLWPTWWERWDRFQQAYVPCREPQFDLIIDYLALVRRDEPLRMLDLCCGPGSAGSRLLRSRPAARVVAVDHDPWLLELGRRAAPGADEIVWIDTDLHGDWPRALFGWRLDAVVATTAMQWFTEDEVARIYRDVASLLVSGGVFLISDLMPAGSARARALAAAVTARRRDRGEHWADFWADARAEPAFAALLEERDRRFAERYPRAARPLEFHVTALRAAGFADVTEIWRHGENAVLLAENDAAFG